MKLFLTTHSSRKRIAMKSPILILILFLLFSGCQRNEDDVRALVRSELARMTKPEVFTKAEVVGPYSPAIKIGGFLFISGQIGLNQETGQLEGPDIESQTRRSLENIMALLRQAGLDSSNVIQCTVFLKDINNFAAMNLIYGGYFEEGRYPTRSTVEVSNIPRNAIVEIAAVAYKEPSQ